MIDLRDRTTTVLTGENLNSTWSFVQYLDLMLHKLDTPSFGICLSGLRLIELPLVFILLACDQQRTGYLVIVPECTSG